jgi:hypothetical protein
MENEIQGKGLKIGTLAMPVVACDRMGKISYANTRACSLFGYDDPADLISKPIGCLLPSSMRRAHEAHVSSWMENPMPRSMNGPQALLKGRHRGGRVLRLRIALQWEQDTQSGVALIHSVPDSEHWWLRPKAAVGAMLLVAGVTLTLADAGGAAAAAMLGASFGMLTALAGKGESLERQP